MIAGVGRMNSHRFLTSNLVGALAWAVGLTLTGFYAASIPGVKSAAYVIAGVFIALSIIFGVRTWWIDRAEARKATTMLPSPDLTTARVSTTAGVSTTAQVSAPAPGLHDGLNLQDRRIWGLTPRASFGFTQ